MSHGKKFRLSYVVLSFFICSHASFGQESPPESAEESSPESLGEDELETSDWETDSEPNPQQTSELLDYSQDELIASTEGGFGLGIGHNMPWHFYGLSGFWKHDDSQQLNLSLGGGDFELSTKVNGKTVNVDSASRSVIFSSRYYFTDIAPLFYEPLVGLNFWNGSIRPKGSDSLTDVAASSLTSDFSHRGLTVGFKTGVQWWLQSRVFIEVAIVQLSYTFLFHETYTNNTSDVRKGVRDQLSGLRSWSGINLKVGYAL